MRKVILNWEKKYESQSRVIDIPEDLVAVEAVQLIEMKGYNNWTLLKSMACNVIWKVHMDTHAHNNNATQRPMYSGTVIHCKWQQAFGSSQECCGRFIHLIWSTLCCHKWGHILQDVISTPREVCCVLETSFCCRMCYRKVTDRTFKRVLIYTNQSNNTKNNISHVLWLYIVAWLRVIVTVSWGTSWYSAYTGLRALLGQSNQAGPLQYLR